MVDPLTLTLVCEVIVELGEPLELGATRDGNRRITPILGGELRTVPGLAYLQDSLFIADGIRERSVVRHLVYRVD